MAQDGGCSLIGEDFCGEGVECREENQKAECDCSKINFFASNEFDFEAVELQVGFPVPCNTNIILHYALYAVALVSAILTVGAYTCSLQRYSQARRLIPYYITLLFSAALPAAKLIDRKRFIGEDVFVTFAFALTILFLFFALHVYLNKYVNFHYKTWKIRSATSRMLVDRIEKLLKINSVISILGAAAFCITPFINEFNKDAKLMSFKIGSMIGAVNSVCIFLANVYLLGTLKFDIEKLNASPSDKWKILYNIDGVLYSSCLSFALDISFFLVGAATVTSLKAWKLLIPLKIMQSTLVSLVALHFNKRAKKLRVKREIMVSPPQMVT